MVKDVAFIAYPCRSVASTRAWYESTLGLVFAGPYVEDGIEKYNEAHLAAACFSLMSDEWLGGAAGTGVGIAFEVDDLDASARTLSSQGIPLSSVFDGPVCKSLSLRDPEGNSVTLHERKKPS
jgi:hypothetical protein